MIELKNISFYYNKKKPIFEDLTLNIETGKIYGLLGKNGAGKTTLLKNIAGISFVKSGTSTVFGIESKQRKTEVLEDIFFLPEEVWLPDTTVNNYLKMYSSSWPDFNHDFFSYCLEEFEIQAKSKLKNMSFGQRKKTAISFALATQSKLLILDEPTNGLDIPSKGKFRKLISEIMNENRTIILSTHQVRDLETLIDTIIVLENSEILLNNTIEAICEKLFFKTLSSVEERSDVLYSEFTPRGYSSILKNTRNDESKIDLEALFNFCTQNPSGIKDIFNYK
jgi:ABC-2 type transport system ATP-binding protein